MSEKVVWLKRYVCYMESLNVYIHVPTVYLDVSFDFASVILIMHVTFSVIFFLNNDYDVHLDCT